MTGFFHGKMLFGGNILFIQTNPRLKDGNKFGNTHSIVELPKIAIPILEVFPYINLEGFLMSNF